MDGKRSIRMHGSLIDQPELIEKILIHLGLWPYPPMPRLPTQTPFLYTRCIP